MASVRETAPLRGRSLRRPFGAKESARRMTSSEAITTFCGPSANPARAELAAWSAISLRYSFDSPGARRAA